MMAILLLHTEIYYTGAPVIPYGLYVFDALIVFFFVSGYFCNKHERTDFPTFLATAKGIGRSLVLPYFVFTLALSAPKALVHGASVTDAWLGIVMGRASWFVAALIVGRLLLALLLWLTRRNLGLIGALSILSFGAAVVISNHVEEALWQTDIALMALPVLFMGFLYREYEKSFSWLATPLCSVLLALAFVGLKYYVVSAGVRLLVYPFSTTSYPIFVTNALLSCALALSVARQMPPVSPVEWIGRRSLGYYFLAGGIPLLTGLAFVRLGLPYGGCYARVLAVYTCVMLLTALAVGLIYRYIPFVVGKRRARA